MIYDIGQIVKVQDATIANKAGKITWVDAILQVKITRTSFDNETGHHFMGEIFLDSDVQICNEAGQTEFPPEHYKQYGNEMYQEVLKSYEYYNPKIVYFSEFEIIDGKK